MQYYMRKTWSECSVCNILVPFWCTDCTGMVRIARHGSAEQGHAIHFGFLFLFERWVVCMWECVCVREWGNSFSYWAPITYFQSQLEQNRLGENGRAADIQPTICASCPYWAFICEIIDVRRKAKNQGARILPWSPLDCVSIFACNGLRCGIAGLAGYSRVGPQNVFPHHCFSRARNKCSWNG